MQIREPVQQDAENLARLHVKVWEETYRGIISDTVLNEVSFEKRLDMWTKILGTKKPNVFIAEMDGELAGFIGYGAPRDKEMPFDCELRAINILEKFHRKGIGRALVSRAINKLRNAGHKHVYLWVAQDNINAVSFYEHLGFLKTEHQKTERDIKEICYSLVLEK